MSPPWTRAFVALIGLLFLAPVISLAQERPSEVLKRAAPAETPADASPASSKEDETPTPDVPLPKGESAKVIVIPIDDQIASPILFIVRRGLKEAIESQADAVILEIETPGGSVGTMLEIMEALDRFDGTIIAYVNDEAISAGALLASIADEIWYAPKAVIGSAGVVMGGGEEVPETMKQKVQSYVQAKLRALESADRPYGTEVVKAMMEAEYELVIDGEVISPEGEMLNLTAEEAMTRYGDPPTPLFGNGVATDVKDLLSQRYGQNNWEKVVFEVTWSEELAKWLTAIGPILMTIGILGIFIELKTPGFGLFGIAGVTALVIFFLSNYVAGLAGMEPLLIMVLGLALIAVDVFLLPGTIIPSIIGLLLIFGSFLWSMTDIWPEPDGDGITFEWASFQAAAFDLSLGILLSGALIIVLWNVLPKTHLFDRLILGAKQSADGGTTALGGQATDSAWPAAGAEGVVTRPLHPGGEVEIEGQRYFARVTVGSLPKGAEVRVVGRIQSGVEVEPV